MRRLLTAAAIAAALAGAGCASRVYVAAPPPPVVVAPAPVYVAPVCRWRLVRVVRPSGAVVYRRVRVCR